MDVTATILLVVRQELCIASCQQPIRNRSDEKVPDRGTNDQPCGAHYHFDKAILLVAEGLIEFGGVQVARWVITKASTGQVLPGRGGNLVARPLHCIGDACSLTKPACPWTEIPAVGTSRFGVGFLRRPRCVKPWRLALARAHWISHRVLLASTNILSAPGHLQIPAGEPDQIPGL